MTADVTEEEQQAINDLQRLRKRWPKTLWLFSASGTLCVMRKGPDGNRATLPGGGVDQAYIVATVGIENDGGDW